MSSLMNAHQDDHRVIELEMKMAHQELAIERLQTEVFAQAAAIERLEKTVKRLTDRMVAQSSGALEIGPGNERPPHW